MGHNRLTDKQEKFAQAIANKKYKFHWEAYQAIYDAKKSSRNTLYVKSCELLQNGKVTARIREIEDKIKAQEIIKLDEILVKLSKRCNLDIRDLYDDDNALKNIKDMTADQAMFIVEINGAEIWEWQENEKTGKKERITIGETKKVKIESIKDIMDMFMRHYGAYAKDKETGSSDLEAVRDIINGCLKK